MGGQGAGGEADLLGSQKGKPHEAKKPQTLQGGKGQLSLLPGLLLG